MTWKKLLLLQPTPLLTLLILIASPTQTQAAIASKVNYSDSTQRVCFIQQPLSNQEKIDFSEDGRPGRRRGAGSRDSCPEKAQDKHIMALVPEINLEQQQTPLVLGLTTTEHPTFWFYVPYQPNPPRDVKFVLFDVEDEEDIYEATFQFNSTPGVISISLPVDVTPLEIGRNYRWSFSFICNPRNRSADDVVMGWIKRITLDTNLMSQLESATTQRERILLYAANGIWHDALTALAELRQLQPQDELTQTDWEDLLKSVELSDIVLEPIVS